MDQTEGQEISLRDKLLIALRTTVVELMATMAMSEAVFAGEEVRTVFAFNNEAGGLVRLSGGHEGMLGVATNLTLLREVVSRIVGLDPGELTREDLLDGVAELANMICGNMKTKAQAGDIVLAPPIAIIGKEYSAEWKTNLPTTILTFQMDEGVLQVYASV